MAFAERPKILLFGAGSVGTIYLYLLSKVASTTAVCRSNYHVVKKDGFTINSSIFGQNIHFKPHVARTCEEAAAQSPKPYDYIIVCSKAIPGTVPKLIAPAVTPGHTAIVLIQNGVGIEEEFLQAHPGSPIVSAVVYLPVTQRPAGVITHGEVEQLQIGAYPSSAPSTSARSFTQLVASAGGTAEFYDDIQPKRWFKLLVNASWNPICALTLSKDTQVLTASEEATEVLRAVMLEIRDVAAAYGHEISRKQVDVQLGRALARIPKNAGIEPSMLQDVQEGRRIEVEAIVGNPVRMGRQKGVTCVRLEMLLRGGDALDHCEAVAIKTFAIVAHHRTIYTPQQTLTEPACDQLLNFQSFFSYFGTYLIQERRVSALSVRLKLPQSLTSSRILSAMRDCIPLFLLLIKLAVHLKASLASIKVYLKAPSAFSMVTEMFSDFVDFLYWEIYDEIRTEFTENAEQVTYHFIAFLIFFMGTFVLCVRFNFSLKEFFDWLLDDGYPNLPPTPLATPSPPSRPKPIMATLTPPPVAFPFKNFCGTGESFAPSRQLYRAQNYRPIPAAPSARPTPLGTTGDLVKPVVKTPVPEDVKRAVDAKPVPVEKHVAAAPGHKVLEALPRIAPAVPPPPPQHHFSSAPQDMGVTQAPLQPPQSPPSQGAVAVLLALPLTFPSPETMRKHALLILAQKELMLQEQMEIFVQAFGNGFGRYHYYAVCLGFGSLLKEFQYIEPPAPAPESQPQPQSMTVPAHTVVQPQPQKALDQAAGYSPTSRMPPPASAFSFGSAIKPASTPIKKTPQRTPRTPHPHQRPTPQQHQPTPSIPGLLNFDGPDWSKQPDSKLNALSWKSFAWPSPSRGILKIWSHSTMGRLVLPQKRPSVLTARHVKDCLENVAADFKRAAVLLRLQARDCKKPGEDELGMEPLLGEISTLIKQAAELTESCNDLAVWDSLDLWYQACVYFRDHVRDDEHVWSVLRTEYGPERCRPLMTAWNDASSEWVGLPKKKKAKT
ncbi:2-dehydropantoate 2-reductase [Stemphylium lycopersici]|nr:2-dehydropantoate 2-reductase [Stemphylium lycopersici]